MNFKERQIDIYNKEISLNKETNKLVYDLVSSLSPIQKAKVTGYSFTNGFDSYEIKNIIVNAHSIQLSIENELGDEEIRYLVDLTQVEQKQLIDYIMANILKW